MTSRQPLISLLRSRSTSLKHLVSSITLEPSMYWSQLFRFSSLLLRHLSIWTAQIDLGQRKHRFSDTYCVEIPLLCATYSASHLFLSSRGRQLVVWSRTYRLSTIFPVSDQHPASVVLFGKFQPRAIHLQFSR